MNRRWIIVAICAAAIGIAAGSFAVITFKHRLTQPQASPAHSFHAIGQF